MKNRALKKSGNISEFAVLADMSIPILLSYPLAEKITTLHKFEQAVKSLPGPPFSGNISPQKANNSLHQTCLQTYTHIYVFR